MATSAASWEILRFTQKERPIDRYLVSQTFRFEENPNLLFATVLEINNRWHPAREIGASLPQTFIRHFSRSTHQSTLTKFEDALKNLNKFLQISISRVDVPINCAIIIVDRHEVYFSTLGVIDLFLIRHDRVNKITKGETEATDSFTTVTSGELMDEEWLFAANGELGTIIKNLPLDILRSTDSQILENYLIEQICERDRTMFAGLALRVSDDGGEKTIFLDELESRLPLHLPKLSGRRALPTINAGQLGSNLKRIGQTIKSAVNNFFDQLPGFDLPFPTTWLYGGAALIVALLVILSLRTHASTPKTATTTQPSLISQLNSTDPANLMGFLNNQLTSKVFQALSANDKQTLVAATQAGNITLLTPSQKIATLKTPIAALAPIGSTTDLAIIDESGQLWLDQSSTLKKATQNTLLDLPQSIVAFSPTKIVVGDKTGNLWLFDGSANQPINLTLPKGIAQTDQKLIAGFQNNLYVYDAVTNIVWRVASFTNSLSTASSYTPANIIKNPPLVAWTITGDILGVTTNNQVESFRKTLTAINFTPTITGAVSVTAQNSSTGAITLFVGKNLVTFDTTGKKLSQSFLLSDSPLTAATSLNNNLLVALGTTIYQLSP